MKNATESRDTRPRKWIIASGREIDACIDLWADSNAHQHCRDYSLDEKDRGGTGSFKFPPAIITRERFTLSRFFVLFSVLLFLFSTAVKIEFRHFGCYT